MKRRSTLDTPHQKQLVRRSFDAMKGCIIGRRYLIRDAIGAGGMGVVYEASDLETGQDVALKALHPGTYDAVRLKRLRLEAATMTAIRSPYVCKVHHLDVEQGTPFIIMERLHGETLRTRLAQHGPLSLGDVVSIMCQLLDALTATHNAGVIHRDVKPSNVFLVDTPSGRPLVKLIDFGLAKMQSEGDGAQREEITTCESVPGTLQYLAPEQLLGTGVIDERVDVYAAGVNLFEMLTGQRAFQGTYVEVVHDICLNPPPRVTAHRPGHPALFDDIVAMAMAKEKTRRFASAQAFKRAILLAFDSGRPELQSGVVPSALLREGHLPAPIEDDDNSENERTTLRSVAPPARRPSTSLPIVVPPPRHSSRSMRVERPVPEASRAVPDPDDFPTVRPPPPSGSQQRQR